MAVSLFDRFGFDASAIAKRLRLVELDKAETSALGCSLQQRVIRPHIDAIVEHFYDSLLGIEGFREIVVEHSNTERVRDMQKRYLLGMGMNCTRREYFEERLRIGSVHQRVGVPQSLYLCTFQGLQGILIDYIPPEIRRDRAAFEAMIRFILKVTALDMSLAVESYCAARVSNLKKSLISERDTSDRWRKLAVTDWLTNLHNHSYSRRYLGAALRQVRTNGSSMCIIMADLDHFKEINDKHGHLVGDEVLRIAAARIISGSRAGDEICRYGGEEFLIILSDTDLKEADEVAERVRGRIKRDAIHSRKASIELTLSLGLAQARADDSVDNLIDRADAALYAAKAAGRDCVRCTALTEQ